MHIPIPALVVLSLLAALPAIGADDRSEDKLQGRLRAADNLKDHLVLRREIDCTTGVACPIVMFPWDGDQRSGDPATDTSQDGDR